MTTSPTEADDIGHRLLLPRGVIVLLGAAAAVIIAGGMRAASGFVAPIFFALVLTIACAPVRQVALRHRWPMTLLARAVFVDADPSASWARAFIGSTPQPKDDLPAPEPAEPELEHGTAG